ncbi:MAG: ubiquinol-cytochrome c reductase iron-sulfur subunit [Deltaproteobacteria bacterium]|nr:ubiquinol-cytochrome c reductase iron-sulfur subunit [Deltaproteobacteria bacterium]
MSLRVLPSTDSSTSDCGCSRRTLLQGAAVAAGAVAIAGCGGGGSGDDDAVDASNGGGDAASTGVTMCGANLCVDLNVAANAALAAVGGAMVIIAPAPHGKLIVAQPTADTFVAMSAICTHAGCTVAYQKATNIMACPCHGSKYDVDGKVAVGPAARDLKTFAAAVDASKVVTITLA